jgi:AraC-like DNA-binding protein
VGLEGPFEVQMGPGSPSGSFEALLVAPNAEHRVEGRGLPLAIYYVDGSSAEGRLLARCLEGEGARPLVSEAGELRSILQAALARTSPSPFPLLRARVAEVLGCPPPMASEGDPAVPAAGSLLEESLAAPFPVSELARRVGLHQRELSARFRRETGLTIRRYVLWLRLKAAVASLAESRRTLTEAAHAAGFADAAHFSRTFVEMFGVSPPESVVASSLRVLENS